MTDSTRLLIVDDKPENLDLLLGYLSGSGYDISVATSGQAALNLVASHPPALILLDVMMPDMDGYEVCRQLRHKGMSLPVIFMSALSDTQSKLQAFEAGGIDYVTKPLQREEVRARIDAQITIVKQQLELADKNRQLQTLISELQSQIEARQQVEVALRRADETISSLTKAEARRWGIEAFVGCSPAVVNLLDDVRSLQQAPHTNVLILGESGTGKELISRSIHFGGRRGDKPFVAVNCSAIPADLADAEFFGHVKGAFTGATGDRIGYFECADGGTLFLDEIGDMPLSMQAKLLRVLEDGKVCPVGGRQERQVQVRIIAATNHDLQQRVREKAFRSDLYFRLAGYTLALPSLRQRREDIPLLVEHFLKQLCQHMGREAPQIADPALQRLSEYDFPGNVRELRNMLEYALIASRGRAIGLQHLHFFDTERTTSAVDYIEDESAVLDYVKTHERIDNRTAQDVLGVDHGRASYVLKKLHKEGSLKKRGERRWSYYVLK